MLTDREFPGGRAERMPSIKEPELGLWPACSDLSCVETLEFLNGPFLASVQAAHDLVHERLLAWRKGAELSPAVLAYFCPLWQRCSNDSWPAGSGPSAKRRHVARQPLPH